VFQQTTAARPSQEKHAGKHFQRKFKTDIDNARKRVKAMAYVKADDKQPW